MWQVTAEGLLQLGSCCSLKTLVLGGEADEVPPIAFEEPQEDNKVQW